MSMSGDDGICFNCKKWFADCKCAEQLQWLTFDAAKKFPRGCVVVRRWHSREQGWFCYAITDSWNPKEFHMPYEDDAEFLRLD
jgi:hypothetical protein